MEFFMNNYNLLCWKIRVEVVRKPLKERADRGPHAIGCKMPAKKKSKICLLTGPSVHVRYSPVSASFSIKAFCSAVRCLGI